MKKRLLSMLLCSLILCMTFSTIIYASTNNNSETVQPRWTTLSTVNASLTITDSNAYCKTTVTTGSRCTITATMKLQKKSGSSWVTVKTWTGSATDAVRLSLGKNYTISSGTYRVYSTVSANGETATAISASKTK